MRKTLLNEFLKTDSIYSSMRLFALWMVKTSIALAIFITVATVGCAIANVFLQKPIELPYGALIGLDIGLATIGFGGKAAQSFSESDISSGSINSNYTQNDDIMPMSSDPNVPPQ